MARIAALAAVLGWALAAAAPAPPQRQLRGAQSGGGASADLCGDVDSQDCITEFANANASGSLEGVCGRCFSEQGSDPLRKRCRKCCAECPQALPPPNATTCKSGRGVALSCGVGSECCGGICMAAGGTCCTNELGDSFACAAGDQCCGNTCAAGGDKCCANAEGTKYAVSAGSPCVSEMKSCTNRHGVAFFCGKGSHCCGDGCAAPDAVCCEGNAGVPSFSCAKHSQCCGSVCSTPGSRCCTNENGDQYPIAGTYAYPWEKNASEHCSKV